MCTLPTSNWPPYANPGTSKLHANCSTKCPNVMSSLTTLLTALWRHNLFHQSKRLFHSMLLHNVVSYNSIIAACFHNNLVEEALHYFRAMKERNLASWNVVVSGLVRCDRVEKAWRVFEVMPTRNVVSYTAMVCGFAKRGDMEKARGLFGAMLWRNVVSWTVMICGYLESGRFDEARALFREMPEKNVVAVTVMVTGCCKEGRVDEGRYLFDGVRVKDDACWNAMITGYAQNGRGEEALELHFEKLKTGLRPENNTLVSVLMACSTLASLKDGMQAHALIIKHGFESNVSLCNALITMYCRCGAIFESELVFKQLKSRDTVSWNTILAAFAQHSLYENAIAFFNLMRVSGFEPDEITFLSILSAWARVGKVSEGLDLFGSMVNNYGISPRPEHYACLVDLFSRASQLEKACKMIQEMPFEADFGIWGALLAASSGHSNVKIGELAAKNMLDLDPQNSGPYVILSNIYAATGKWNDVATVRSLMEEHGVKKQQAYSWTEIGCKVHNFFGGDISHPDVDKICLVLKKINLHIAAADNFTDISLS